MNERPLITYEQIEEYLAWRFAVQMAQMIKCQDVNQLLRHQGAVQVLQELQGLAEKVKGYFDAKQKQAEQVVAMPPPKEPWKGFEGR